MLNPVRRRGLPAALAAAAALGLAGCTEDGTVAEPTPAPETEAVEEEAPEVTAEGTEVVSGTTTFQLDEGVQRVLDLAGVEVGAAGEAAEAAGHAVEIPVTAGQIDLNDLSGRIDTGGGISFSAAGQTVEANELALELDQNQVTAEVEGARIPLLDVDFDQSEITRQGENIELPPEAVRLSDEAVDELNQAIGVDVFRGGLELGRLGIEAQTQGQG